MGIDKAPQEPRQENLEQPANLGTPRDQLEAILGEEILSIKNTKESVSDFIQKWEREFFDASKGFAKETLSGEDLFETENLPWRLCRRMHETYGVEGVKTFFDVTCDLFPEHSSAVETIWGDGGLFEMVGLDFFIDRMVELATTKDSRAIPHLVEALTYTFSVFYESASYRDTIKRNLDIDDPASWPRTTKFLEALRFVLIESFENQDEQAHIILDALRDIDTKQGGNYILHLRIKQLIAAEESPEAADIAHMAEDDLLPFILGKKTFGFHFGDELYLSEEKDYEQIAALINKAEEHSTSKQHNTSSHDHELRFEEEKTAALAMADIWPFLTKKLSIDDVVLSRKDTDHAHRVEDLIDYKYLVIKPVREHLKDDLSADIAELSIPEQFNFLSFLKRVSAEDVSDVRAFTETFGTDGLRTFLSLEHDRGFGPSILAIGEALPKESAQALFKRYGELVDAAREAESYVLETFGKESSRSIVDTISHQLLSRANNLLKQSIEQSGQENEPEVLAERIETILMNANADIALFTATFKTLASQNESIDLEHIRDIEFVDLLSQELTKEDAAAMKAIYAKNYRSKPDLQTALIEKFENEIAVDKKKSDGGEQGNRFYVLKHKGVIVAFDRFKTLENGNTYFGSFNVDPTYQNHRLGQVFLDETIRKESLKGGIEADCSTVDPIAMHYIEMGFVGTSSFNFQGEPSMHIEYRAGGPLSKLDKETLIAQADTSEAIERGVIANDIAWERLNNNETLTRYFKKDGYIYAVFEKLSTATA